MTSRKVNVSIWSFKSASEKKDLQKRIVNARRRKGNVRKLSAKSKELSLESSFSRLKKWLHRRKSKLSKLQ